MTTKRMYILGALLIFMTFPVLAAAEAPTHAIDPAVFLLNLRGPNNSPLSLPPATDPSTPLYNPASGLPLLAPDGHHITLGEWVDFDAKASLKCTPQGTHVHMSFRGLVPYGLYNIFIFGRQNPGDFAFFGVLHSTTSSETVFTTNGQGNAEINAIVPGGELSAGGVAPHCLVDAFEHNFIVMYRLNGQTTGGVPGPPTVRVNHIFFDLWDDQ